MVFLSACVLCGALAAASSPSPSPTPLPEIAHVSTSDRSDTTLRNTARTTYTISREEIERRGYRTIAQALTDIPALIVSPLGAVGSGANITLRGSSSAQTLVLIDGLPAPGSFSNSVEIGALPVTGVERIEVVEGGGSTLYGTGAIGGIINIITERTAPLHALLRAGSLGEREVELSAPNVQYDRIVSTNTFVLPDGSVRSGADYRSTAVHANLDRTFGAFDAALRAGIQSDHLGAPGPVPFASLTSRENDVNRNADLVLTHRASQSLATLQFGAAAQQIAFACDAATDPSCFQPSASLSTDERVFFGARNAVRSDRNQLLYGIDLSRGFVRSDDGFSDVANNAMAQSAAYAEDHVYSAHGSLYAGVRGERDGGLGGEISPSAGFVILAGTISVRGNLASAFRAPNASELYFPNYGNPSLKAERAHVADITLADSSLLGGATLGWFGNRTRNLIAFDPSALAPENIDDALIEGLTFTLRAPPSRGYSASLNLTDMYRAQDLNTLARLPGDPVFSGSLHLDYAAPHANSVLAAFGMDVRTAGKRGAFAPPLPAFDAPIAYTAFDAYATLRAGQRSFFTLRGLNLSDRRYAAVSGFPLPGRTVVVELSVK